MSKFVIYANAEMTLVMTEKNEDKIVKLVFGNGDQDIDTFERCEVDDDYLVITPQKPEIL